jgi:hypothetical protein
MKKNLFRSKALQQITIGLVVFSAKLCLGVNTVESKPAPIFRPVLSELQQKLPDDLSMKLPTFFPPAPLPANFPKLYPRISSDQYGTGVAFYTDPKGEANVWYMGSVGVQRIKGDLQLSEHDCVQQQYVTLARNIRALYSSNRRCGWSTSGQSLTWDENGLRYGFYWKPNASISDLKKMANTMIESEPIYSYRGSRQRNLKTKNLQSLQHLPDGKYLFGDRRCGTTIPADIYCTVFYKSGDIALGGNYYHGSEITDCFLAKINRNTLLFQVIATPILSRNANSEFEITTGGSFNLEGIPRLSNIDQAAEKGLSYCTRAFEKISKNY